MTKTKAGRSTVEDSASGVSHVKDLLNKQKSDYLEGQSRRNNMVGDGIAWNCRREMIFEKLKMDHRKIEVEHADRTGKPTTDPGGPCR